MGLQRYEEFLNFQIFSGKFAEKFKNFAKTWHFAPFSR
jgi:hypothetical protein